METSVNAAPTPARDPALTTPAAVVAAPKTNNETPPSTDFEELPLEGFEPAVAFYRPKAPKLVITHGAGGHASYHCEHWRQLLKAHATLICLRGKRRSQRDMAQGYYYPDHLALGREIEAATAAFETRYESLAVSERYLYAGYSQGATMGALALAGEGAKFSHLILVEGGYNEFSRPLATRFKNSGGMGVLFVCGTQGCHDQARANAIHVTRLAMKAEVRWARGAGHRPDGPVARELVAGLPLIFGDDPRWAGFEPATPAARFD